MDLLKLGHTGLTAAEEGLVATLFRLHGIDRSFIWTLSAKPPFDALLVDIQCPETEFRHLLDKHTRVMRLQQHGVPSDGAMPRPIRSDLLLNWLNSIELGLLHSTGNSFATTAHQSQHEQTSILPQFKTLATPPVPAQPSISTPSEPSLPPGWALRNDSTVYKLKRWPLASLLNKDVTKVRVATMFSRRAMSLQDASNLSRISPKRCEELLLEWASHGLVSMSDAPVAPARNDMPETLDSVPSTTVPPPRHGFGASLIHSIRKRFGIL